MPLASCLLPLISGILFTTQIQMGEFLMPYSQLPTPDSRLPIPDSRFPIPVAIVIQITPIGLENH
ncbi:MAG: hypothetical protein F6K55_07730 [Moorea sp. SIO4A3]|nr:hypothetical protein [Moorena sp. SIO4A3]